jgi:hypothetical protein
MSYSIAFLISPDQTHNDNHIRLPRLFADAGWQVSEFCHDDMSWRDESIYLADRPANVFTLIWPVGLGPQKTFLDRQQLLQQLDQNRLITPAQTYLTLHGKTAWLQHAPPTTIACEAKTLRETLALQGGDWVLKPVAGSFGTDVHRVHSALDIDRILSATPTQYWMLQQFIAEIEHGETRTLICGEEIIGSYLRTPTKDLRANLAAHGQASGTELSAADRNIVARVHRELILHRVGFAAIDTVGGYLMEVNMANPGGLQTLENLYGRTQTLERNRKIVQAVETRQR